DEDLALHHPNVPPCLPGKTRFTLRNEATRMTKPTMVMVAALRPRQPTVRACSNVAYKIQGTKYHTCTGSQDHSAPQASLAAKQPVVNTMVRSAKPQVTKR